MPAAVGEEVTASDPNFATSTNTVTATFTTTIASGDHLVALVARDTGTGTGPVTVSDSVNGVWPRAIGDRILNAIDNGDLQAFVFLGSAAAGTGVVVTATMTNESGVAQNHVGKGIRIYKVTGAPGGLGAFKYNAAFSMINQPQTNPGGATDAIVSGTVTPLAQPALIISLCEDTSGSATPTVGTGYTDGGTGWGFGGVNTARSENRRVTSITSTQATYTVSGVGATHIYATMILVFLEVTLPSISVQPTNQSVFVGQTATFNITASGTGTVHYQWRSNGSNVGTDSSSYTTSTLSASDNHSLIDCVVTDDNGNVTSTVAVLTVSLVPSIAWI